MRGKALDRFNDRIGGMKMLKRSQAINLTVLPLFLLLSSCAPPSSPPTATTSPIELDVPAATLPPAWTMTPSSIASPSPTGTGPPLDPTQHIETETISIDPTLTPIPASPTSVPTKPEEVLEAAWQAFLANDEALLTSYYNPHGQMICKLGFGTMVRCVGIAYQVRGLRTIENWYTLEPLYVTDSGVLIVLRTEWAESESAWDHGFTLYKENGIWQLDEPETIVYEYNP